MRGGGDWRRCGQVGVRRVLAIYGVNVRTIAQGSSERQISICVEKEDCTKALRAAHAALALSNTQLCVAVIGSTGMVGSELLQQLAESKRVFADPQALSARRQARRPHNRTGRSLMAA